MIVVTTKIIMTITKIINYQKKKNQTVITSEYKNSDES